MKSLWPATRRAKQEDLGLAEKVDTDAQDEPSQQKQDGLSADWMDRPLLQLSPMDAWTIRESFNGTSCMGGTGSGKTSGSGAAIARAFLNAGYGGFVCCAKPEDRPLFEQYCAETGRSDDLIIVSPEHPWRFNFLDYELNREGAGAGQTENLVALFAHIAAISEGKAEQQGSSDFWHRSMQQIVRNAVNLIALAAESMTLDHISELITSAPQYLQQHEEEEWRERSYCWQCITQARSRERDGQFSTIESHDFQVCYRFWMQSYAGLADRTRSGIVATFTSIADTLLHGVLWELLCTETTLVPDVAYKEGKIIVIDLPIQEWHDVARICQGIFKYMFQRCVLSRDVTQYPLPVFLWADEAQNFVSKFDFRYQAVARSARAATVYLTQNISNYYSVLGSQSKDEAHAFLGNLKTQIFHAQGDISTNQYASDMVSNQWMRTKNYGISNYQEQGGSNAGASEGIHPKILPSHFTRLRQGGPLHGLEVDAVVFQSGRIWEATGDTYLPVIFKQQ